MKICVATLVAAIFYGAQIVLAEKRYDGYQVYSIVPKKVEDLLILKELNNEYDFWMDAVQVGHPAEVVVPPFKLEEFQAFLTNNGFKAQVTVANIQEVLDSEKRQRKSEVPKRLEWTEYHEIDEIYAWLDEQAANRSNVQVVVAGTTYEGREIRALEITNGVNLPGVILESGIHAREWIGPAATSWIVNQILNSAANSTWRQFNYLYFPHLNPDGYAYTWSDDRLWRKTRKPYANGCVGADPNRNFDNHWLEGGGASANPCSETYGGPEPFSEVETKTYSQYLRNVSSKYDIYVAFHSAAQLLLFPWGWTADPAPLNDLWQRIGDASAADIAKVNGTVFEVGPIYTTIYPASATSMDWYYGEFNSTLSYTYEMRSGYGFVLPPQFIIPCGQEHLAGLLTLLNAYLEL